MRLPVATLLLLLALMPFRAWPDLTVLNWPDYLNPEVVVAFQQSYGVQVTLNYFETDDDRDLMLAQTDGRGYDVILVNGSSLASYVRRGWLEPLDSDILTQLEHMDPRWLDAYPGAVSHGVPYLWGTLGIAYRRDLVETPPASWLDLLQPESALSQRIVMVDTARVSVAIALKALGYSANSTASEALDAAEALLLAQRPHVKAYGYVDTTEGSALVTGEIAAAMMYSGDALVLQDHHPEVSYVVPKEGGELWVDYWTVSSASPHKALAWAFIDFISRPEHAAANAITLNYPSPSRAAERLLPSEFLANPAIYPEPAILARSQVLSPLPPVTMRRLVEIHRRVLREGGEELPPTQNPIP